MKSKLEAEYSLNSNANYWLRQQASEFGYSDGEEVEQRLLDIIEKAQDLRSGTLELRAHITDWPTRYHLSPLRTNLLRPFQHVLKGSILEVGAGCGAITRFLGECGGNVLALEGSAFRAKIAASRCRDLKNVTVVADGFHQFRALSGFDVVTLIGVVEYARKYFICNSGDPVDAMLAHARELLRPGGILIVAIENQLGLKYFAGFPEDHTGVPMHGIEDQYRRDGVVTFGQAELRRRLSGAGFHEQKWWFPFPDYKLPVSILSEELVEGCLDVDLTPLLENAVSLDSQRPATFLFSLEKAWEPVSRNQLTGKLANSFLILASDRSLSQLPADELGYHYALERRPEFAKKVVFLRKPDETIWVRQVPLFPEATSHENLPLTIHFEDEAFVRGEHWQHRLICILNTPNWVVADLETWASTWFKALIEKAGLAHTSGSLSAFHTLPGSLFDAIPRNMILRADDHPYFIDQEWRLNLPVELGFLVFRGVALALLSVSSVAQPARGTPTQVVDLFSRIAQSLGIWVTEQDILRYASFENDIQRWAIGMDSSLTPEQLMRLRLPVRSTVAERDDAMAQRDAAVAERDRQIAAMKQRDAALAERDGQLAALNHRLEERERFAQKALADKEHELIQIARERGQFAQEVTRLQTSVQHHRMALNMIHGSLGWLVTSKFRRLKDKYLMPDSRRRELYDRLLAKMKNRLKDGHDSGIGGSPLRQGNAISAAENIPRDAAKTEPITRDTLIVRQRKALASDATLSELRQFAVYASSLGNYFFLDLCQMIAAGLRNLGYDVDLRDENCGFSENADWHVVVAPHEFFYLGNGERLRNLSSPSNLIMVNTEQPSTQWYSRAYQCFTKTARIWDINYASSVELARQGFPCEFLPLGYMSDFELFGEVKELPLHYGTCFLDERIRKTSCLNEPIMKRPIDVLFLGTLSQRREQFFAQAAPVLSKYRCYLYLPEAHAPLIAGLNTHIDTLTSVGLCQRSKILLNLHRGEDNYFEWHRIVLLGLWNRLLVISEPCGKGPPFQAGVHFVEAHINQIPDLVEYYLRDPNGRDKAQEMVQRGFQTLTENCRLTDVFRPILLRSCQV